MDFDINEIESMTYIFKDRMIVIELKNKKFRKIKTSYENFKDFVHEWNRLSTI